MPSGKNKKKGRNNNTNSKPRQSKQPQKKSASVQKGKRNRKSDIKYQVPEQRSREHMLSSFQGRGTIDPVRTYVMDGNADFITDIANIISNVLERTIDLLINTAVIDKWNATQRTAFMNLTLYGAQLLYELKIQNVILAYMPAYTRNDAAAGSPFTRASYEGLLASLGHLRLPVLSYVLANFYTRVIQLHGAEYVQGTTAAYLLLGQPSYTLANLETLIGTIEGTYEAVVYATQAQLPLVPIDGEWLNTIDEVPIMSQFGMFMSVYLPFKVNDGGVVDSFGEVDETTSIHWNQWFGIPEFQAALVLLRISECADSPYFYVVNDPAADKFSVREAANPGTTTLTEVGKADSILACFKYYAAAMAALNYSNGLMTSESMGHAYVATALPSPSAWDRRLANYLADHFRDAKFADIGLPLLPDIIMGRRINSGVRATPGTPAANTLSMGHTGTTQRSTSVSGQVHTGTATATSGVTVVSGGEVGGSQVDALNVQGGYYTADGHTVNQAGNNAWAGSQSGGGGTYYLL